MKIREFGALEGQALVDEVKTRCPTVVLTPEIKGWILNHCGLSVLHFRPARDHTYPGISKHTLQHLARIQNQCRSRC